MFDRKQYNGPKIGRKHVAVRPNAMGEGYVLQVATRIAEGYEYAPNVGPVFVSLKEAREYRRKYIYRTAKVNGGFLTDMEIRFPMLAICRHAQYRGHEDMCVEDGCPYVAYQKV